MLLRSLHPRDQVSVHGIAQQSKQRGWLVVGSALRRIGGLVVGGMCVGWLTCLYCCALASLFLSAPPHGHGAAVVMVCMGCVCGCGVME